MEPRTRKKLFFGIAIASMLALIVLGLALTFARSLDQRGIFVDIPLHWGLLPFSLGFTVYIYLEFFFSKKYGDEGLLFLCRSKDHQKIVNVTFFVANLFLLAGVVLTLSLAGSINNALLCFVESFISVPPLLFYLGYTLFAYRKENPSTVQFLCIGGCIGVIALGETIAFLLTLRGHDGFYLTYGLIPLVSLVLAALPPYAVPSPEPETLE